MVRPLAAAAVLACSGVWAQTSDTPEALIPAPLKSSPLLQEHIPAEVADQLPSFIRGDHVTGQADVRAQVQGHAELRKGDTVVRADQVDYTLADDLVDAEGNVHINKNGDVYQGTALKLHVDAFKGQFNDASYQFLQTQAHGDAVRVDFIDRDRSVVHDATYTTCLRDDSTTWEPDWVLRAKRIELDRAEEVGYAKSAVLEFKGIPVLPVPAVSFPLSTKRKSGLLPPSIGIDSINGIEYAQPYYWNIAPNRDAMITPTLMSKRGLGLAGEFRYLEPAYSGTLRLEGMTRDKLRDRDRWAYSWQHLQNWNTPIGGLGLNLNLNRVSDGDYWRDFMRTDKHLRERLVNSEGTLSWGRNDHSVVLRAQKWQVQQQLDSPITPPFDRMPQLQWRYTPYDLPGGFDFAWEADTTRFQARNLDGRDNVWNGQRSYGLAQLTRPILAPGWFIKPKLQLHTSSYQMDTAINGQTSFQRTLPTFSVDSGLVFERDTTFFGKDYVQTLEPRLFYTNTPYRDQSMLPAYDTARTDFNFASIFAENSYVGQDRIADNNMLTAGLTTRWLDRQTGAEAVRLAVAQRLRFKDQLVTLPGEAPGTESLSDLLLGAGFNWSQRWAFDSAVQFNQDERRVKRSTISARYSPGAYRTVSMAYRLQRDFSEQVDLGWQWPLAALFGGDFTPPKGGSQPGGSRWYTVGRLNYSMQDSKMIDTVLGIEYDSCCWIGRVLLERHTNSISSSATKLSFQMEFVGFSRLGVGNDPLGTLKEQIPRYRNLRDGNAPAPSRFSNYD
ncbi:LPS-assembly protein LptD [Comamonas sp. GB3 AK4-5]|uniref:LPS-assembly protein LptD n=1 Tax=Comamonas sp. GB3 AK4-5 TaxID=3231487 RepID=UPI00351E9B4F